MTKKRAEIPAYKKQMVETLRRRIERGQAIFLTECGGLRNRELEELRLKLRTSESSHTVVKHSIGRLALQGSGLEELLKTVKGSIGLGVAERDPAVACKCFIQFAKDHEALRIAAAIVEGRLLSTGELKTLASLPSREVLIAQAAGRILSPAARLVGGVHEILRKLVSVMDAISKKTKEETSHVG